MCQNLKKHWGVKGLMRGMTKVSKFQLKLSYQCAISITSKCENKNGSSTVSPLVADSNLPSHCEYFRKLKFINSGTNLIPRWEWSPEPKVISPKSSLGNIFELHLEWEPAYSKGGGSETARLRADLPFSCTSFHANVLNIFCSERKMGEESNTSCFIFFEALLN